MSDQERKISELYREAPDHIKGFVEGLLTQAVITADTDKTETTTKEKE